MLFVLDIMQVTFVIKHIVDLPTTSIKEKETHWPKEPWTRGKEKWERIWRVTSRPMLQTNTLSATGFFKSAS